MNCGSIQRDNKNFRSTPGVKTKNVRPCVRVVVFFFRDPLVVISVTVEMRAAGQSARAERAMPSRRRVCHWLVFNCATSPRNGTPCGSTRSTQFVLAYYCSRNCGTEEAQKIQKKKVRAKNTKKVASRVMPEKISVRSHMQPRFRTLSRSEASSSATHPGISRVSEQQGIYQYR